MSQDEAQTPKMVRSLEEIPTRFESEDAERAWWAEHELSEELWDSLLDVSDELDAIAPLPRKPPRRRAG